MIYDPNKWHDFFVMVGGGSAALTGLVFVAMTLNIHAVTQDAAHRYRAIGTLTGFAAAFVLCALALMGGQNHQAVGTEWLVVSTFAAVVYIGGYVQARWSGGNHEALRMGRVAFGTLCCVAEIVGAILLITGQVAGLYIAAIGMVVYVGFMITGAWLLIVWTHRDHVTNNES
jgi:hypothetical protein